MDKFKWKKNNSKKEDLDFLLKNNKYLNYEKCFEFIQLSDKFETIYSPSPDVNIVLLFFFLKVCNDMIKLKLKNLLI